jgi:Uri superfamily endonuclease
MKVKIKQRPLDNFGPADCRCCSRLSWKNLKLDKQVLKEAVNDANYAIERQVA